MITFKDEQTNVTAMARATANTISVVAQMIAVERLRNRCLSAEQIVPGEEYIKEMAKRGVYIAEYDEVKQEHVTL